MRDFGRVKLFLSGLVSFEDSSFYVMRPELLLFSRSCVSGRSPECYHFGSVVGLFGLSFLGYGFRKSVLQKCMYRVPL